MKPTKPTARVIVTFDCNRNCPGCCNTAPGFSVKGTNFQDLLQYEEIIITGGEPMLISEYCVEFIHRLQYVGYKGKIYLYTAYNRVNKRWSDQALLKLVDGVTYTIHDNPDKRDMKMLADITEYISVNGIKSPRLHIDSRTRGIEKQIPNVSKIWGEIKYFEWKKECPIIETEDILFFNIKEN